MLNIHPTSESASEFYVHSIVGGLFIGIAAWLMHDKYISTFEDKLSIKFPASAVLFTSTADDGTKEFVKPTTKQ
jgi:formate/nitrite transporter FocA (FNT family)